MNQQQKIQNPHRKMVKRCEQAAYRRGNKKDIAFIRTYQNLLVKKETQFKTVGSTRLSSDKSS